jgi:hypothetical protein
MWHFEVCDAAPAVIDNVLSAGLLARFEQHDSFDGLSPGGNQAPLPPPLPESPV